VLALSGGGQYEIAAKKYTKKTATMPIFLDASSNASTMFGTKTDAVLLSSASAKTYLSQFRLRPVDY
jgi:hypothetical protein